MTEEVLRLPTDEEVSIIPSVMGLFHQDCIDSCHHSERILQIKNCIKTDERLLAVMSLHSQETLFISTFVWGWLLGRYCYAVEQEEKVIQ